MGRNKKQPQIQSVILKNKVTYHANNPGMIMGRCIAFAKFTQQRYILSYETEPCWKSLNQKNSENYSSTQIYYEYLKWLKNR